MDDAETVFNHFRRVGHQFDVEIYNKMIFGWAQKVRKLLGSWDNWPSDEAPDILPVQGSTFRAKLLFKSMIGDGVERNLRTYAALLAAYSKYRHKLPTLFP